MIIPSPLFIAIIAATLRFAGKSDLPKLPKLKRLSSPRPRPQKVTVKLPNIPNPLEPLQTLVKNVVSSTPLANLTGKKEDTAALIKQLLPDGSEILVSQFPPGGREIQLEDLDGDGENEAIVTYTADQEMVTSIYKKENTAWVRAAEIKNSGYDKIHYMNFVDINADGRKEVIIGWDTLESTKDLHIYSWGDQDVQRIARHTYNKLELLGGTKKNNKNSKPGIALWTLESNGVHSINVLNWNGSELAPISDSTPYYMNSVVPYYSQKIEQNPGSANNWYCLTDSLIKAKMMEDALMSINVGMSLNPDAVLRENFLALRKTIMSELNRN